VENRPYEIWANVSDLYVSWSKVAVGLIIPKNDKKLNQLLFDASSMSVSMETTQKIENARSQQPKELEQFFFNEPELTCSYMHLIHLTCLFYMFFEIFKIS